MHLYIADNFSFMEGVLFFLFSPSHTLSFHTVSSLSLSSLKIFLYFLPSFLSFRKRARVCLSARLPIRGVSTSASV